MASQSEEIRELARKLGGGWRIEHGVMPVVVLTIVEAQRLVAKLDGNAVIRQCVVCGAHLGDDYMHKHEAPTWKAPSPDLEGALEGYEVVEVDRAR